jgi:hypothetical protein
VEEFVDDEYLHPLYTFIVCATTSSQLYFWQIKSLASRR